MAGVTQHLAHGRERARRRRAEERAAPVLEERESRQTRQNEGREERGARIRFEPGDERGAPARPGCGKERARPPRRVGDGAKRGQHARGRGHRGRDIHVGTGEGRVDQDAERRGREVTEHPAHRDAREVAARDIDYRCPILRDRRRAVRMPGRIAYQAQEEIPMEYGGARFGVRQDRAPQADRQPRQGARPETRQPRRGPTRAEDPRRRGEIAIERREWRIPRRVGEPQ